MIFAWHEPLELLAMLLVWQELTEPCRSLHRFRKDNKRKELEFHLEEGLKSKEIDKTTFLTGGSIFSGFFLPFLGIYFLPGVVFRIFPVPFIIAYIGRKDGSKF